MCDKFHGIGLYLSLLTTRLPQYIINIPKKTTHIIKPLRQKYSRGIFMSIIHPFDALFDKNSKILILGSFPSVKSREQGFFYGHPRNRFWTVIAKVLEKPVPATIEEKRSLLLRSGIALWDSIHSCEIEGSADSSIKNVTPNDISHILRRADIRAIFANGKTSGECYMKYVYPQTGRKISVLPSTSPANAAWSVENLVAEYAKIKEFL